MHRVNDVRIRISMGFSHVKRNVNEQCVCLMNPTQISRIRMHVRIRKCFWRARLFDHISSWRIFHDISSAPFFHKHKHHSRNCNANSDSKMFCWFAFELSNFRMLGRFTINNNYYSDFFGWHWRVVNDDRPSFVEQNKEHETSKWK